MRPPLRSGPIRRVVVVVPSLFTLFNLFFGIWSMVLASRGEYYRAGWYIFFAGILDALDGRVARLSNTGSRFGAELDSLVDVVSFGVAPAFLMYQLEFSAFIGLPSPAAGMTLATYYPFTTTELYQASLRFLPWHHLLQLLMILLTILMVSNVRYATVPRAGLRTVRGLLGLATILFVLVFGILEHDAFFFPLGIAYMTYGVLRAALLSFFAEPEEDEEAEIAGPIVLSDAEQGEDVRGISTGGGAT